MADGQFDLRADLLVVVQSFAAGGGDLHERDLVLVQPPFAQKFVNRFQTVAQTLGVVHAVGAEDHDVRIAQFAADFLRPGLNRGGVCQFDECIGVDGNGVVGGPRDVLFGAQVGVGRDGDVVALGDEA